MFNKILIANRGEIACRIIKTAKKHHIKTVAIYSDADSQAQHVCLADEAYHVGDSIPKESYLNINKIISIAKKSGAAAIHPGYGFLSENPDFAEACINAGLVFIGPSVSAIKIMGSKSEAKAIMEKNDVPLLPGYHGAEQSDQKLLTEAKKIGFPVLIKASAGGGGKGMRLVTKEVEFIELLQAARREAMAAFGDDQVLIEKYLEQPRHIEVQVFGDQQGRIVHLFERDCSIQRRHQKVIEEAPSTFLSEDQRKSITSIAVKAAQAIKYVGAGTVEFIVDQQGHFYFMEMNTRLQVEHPVTEMITGQDLVWWQFCVAYGHSLPMTQNQLSIQGHAIEVRLYAEDPKRNFLPTSGLVKHLLFPESNDYIRVDSGIIEGDRISIYYDPMLAKLIVWGENRDQALHRLNHALNRCQCLGIATNIDFLKKIINLKDFVQDNISTNLIEVNKNLLLLEDNLPSNIILCLASLAWMLYYQKSKSYKNKSTLWSKFNYWRLNLPAQTYLQWYVAEREYRVNLDYHTHEIKCDIDNQILFLKQWSYDKRQIRVEINGHQYCYSFVVLDDEITLYYHEHTYHLIYKDLLKIVTDDTMHTGQLTAPVPGKVVHLMVKVGDQVKKGDPLIAIEAMKMEHTIRASVGGKISQVFFAKGDMVEEGKTLIGLDPEE
ncbi:MAG: acetyl/propionyl/methylcrotonyl-CoA carboxylase subunit alpha [Alphaproteobacteria bacterium]|nr:acetyl/propionyl/methylcrotonyl-CoA carboxylase subunit alpha [Alphaproteobacteria bacterium]